MNVSFLVGNGFDINLNLNTRYTDFYPYYQKNCAGDLISESISDDYEIWSDLEQGLGVFLEGINENQINDYLDSKGEIERLLSDYLTLESKRVVISDEKALAEEFRDKITRFHSDFCSVDLEHYMQTTGLHPGTLKYSFISFNYTDVLDRIVEISTRECAPFGQRRVQNSNYQDSLSRPHHIHGELTKDLILGLDNSEQIMNDKLKTNSQLNNYIIKSSVNNALGEKKITIMEEIINGSNYVCLFGLSIGETDKMWWVYIIKWLKNSLNNRLVLFTHNKPLTNLSGQEKIRFRDSKREEFLSRSGCIDSETSELVWDQIIVISNSEIFNLENIKIKEKASK